MPERGRATAFRRNPRVVPCETDSRWRRTGRGSIEPVKINKQRGVPSVPSKFTGNKLAARSWRCTISESRRHRRVDELRRTDDARLEIMINFFFQPNSVPTKKRPPWNFRSDSIRRTRSASFFRHFPLNTTDGRRGRGTIKRASPTTQMYKLIRLLHGCGTP